METGMVRGYSIQQTARFIMGHEDLKQRISAATLQPIAKIAETKPEMWVSRSDIVRLFDIIDGACPDEATAYQTLVSCGQNTANQAVGTFLKLLLRVLSPKQFVKKFPDIWSHDHKGGYVEPALVGETGMSINVRDIEGFRHIGPIATGFISVVLTAMGLKDVEVKDLTWTRANPGARDVLINVSWR